MTAGERLRKIRNASGLSIRAAAEKMGYNSPGSYQYYENSTEKHLPWKFVQKALDVFVGLGQPPVKKADVMRLTNAAEITKGLTVKAESPDEFMTVPIYDIRASAGPGALADDGEPIGFQPYRMQELDRLTRTDRDLLAVIRVAGDSMEPTLHNADQVLIDRTVEEGRSGRNIHSGTR